MIVTGEEWSLSMTLIAELGYEISVSWCDCLPTYDLLCICDNNNFQSEGVDTTLATMFVVYFHRRSVLVAPHLHERQHSSNAYRRVCSMSQWTNRSQIARFLSWQKFICSCLTDGSTCMLLSLRHRALNAVLPCRPAWRLCASQHVRSTHYLNKTVRTVNSNTTATSSPFIVPAKLMCTTPALIVWIVVASRHMVSTSHSWPVLVRMVSKSNKLITTST
jgi:hypothetical protein